MKKGASSGLMKSNHASFRSGSCTVSQADYRWDGVRNYQARNFMRAMAVGDRGFFT